MDYRKRYQVLTFDKDILDAVDIVEQELHEKLTLEGRLIGVEIVPKEAQKYYCSITGRHKTLGIPYSSPP